MRVMPCSALVTGQLFAFQAKAQEFINVDGFRFPKEALCTIANDDIPCSQTKLTKWSKMCVRGRGEQTNGGLYVCISQNAGVSFEAAQGMVWERK